MRCFYHFSGNAIIIIIYYADVKKNTTYLFKTRFLQTYKNVRFGRLIIFWRNFVYNRDDYFGTSTLYVCGEEINYN